MKIAFVGKGGSGKTSLAWLASTVLRAQSKRVLMIDADHNMDLAHTFGITVSGDTPTLHRAHEAFRMAVGQEHDTRWSDIVLDGRALPTFSLSPEDAFTASVTISIDTTTKLIIIGLGAEDILFSGKCAHGHSAPLKYYLPLLSLNTNEAVIIDGVAGVDMMNFGLFNGADAIVVAVENHPNSIRVYDEITRIAAHTELPIFAVHNKSMDSTELSEVSVPILGHILLDEGVRQSKPELVSTETKSAMRSILEQIRMQIVPNQGTKRIQKFEIARLAAHQR